MSRKQKNIPEEEFELLIQQHSGLLGKMIKLYSNSSEDAKDLQQEILLQWWKSLKHFKSQASLTTYWYKVALNVALNFIKKQTKAKTIRLEKEDLLSQTQEKSDHEYLYLIVKSLPVIDKTLITLHFDGYKNEEIAAIMGISKNNLAVKLHRIKESIANKLKTMYDGPQ